MNKSKLLGIITKVSVITFISFLIFSGWSCETSKDYTGDLIDEVTFTVTDPSSCCSGSCSQEGGNVTFASKVTTGTYAGKLLVYGKANGKEVGIYMNWPPATGIYPFDLVSTDMYYSPAAGANQYGGAMPASGQVNVESLTLNGDVIKYIRVSFSNIRITNGTDNKCITGRISYSP